MSTILSKSIATLLGIVFFVGGASIALAGPAVDQGAQRPVTAQTTAGSTQTISQLQQQITGLNQGILVLQQQLPGASAATQASINTQIQTLQTQLNSTQSALSAAQAGATSGSTASGPNTTSAAAAGSGASSIVSAVESQCGWTNMTACVALVPVYIVYYVFYNSAAFLLETAGKLFDFTIMMSISKQYVGDPTFINDIWVIIRDFSNMLFIFILLYTGIMTMFGSKDWKRTVIQVVVVALLINFSLFFTKIVIDAGNILAVGVYESLGAAPSGSGPRALSAKLSEAFQPQKFISVTQNIDTLVAIVVLVVATIVNVVAAWVFFRVALAFVGRLLAFWFLMIVSPFAFISTALPKGNIFGWWWSTLLAQTFMAPLFLFVIYIIVQIINTGILNTLTQANGLGVSGFLTDMLIVPVLMAVLLLTALTKAKDLAIKMSGEFGDAGAKIAGTVLGVAGGAMLGGAAVAGRTTIGRAAQRLEESGKLRQMATSENKFARFAGRNLMGATDKVRQGTFDARGISTVQKAAGAAGIASIGKPWASAKGGFEGEQKRQGEKDEKFAKRLEMTDDEKKVIAATHGVSAAEEADKKQKEEVAKHTATVSAIETEVKAAKKKVEDATAAHEASRDITGAGDAALAKALADATKEEQDALSKLKGAQSELATATGLAASATAAAEKAKKDADAAVDAENKRRSGKFAEHVEGRIFVPTMGTYSGKQAQATAAKIRTGKTKEEKDEEKATKKLLKAFKKLQEKEGEGKEEEKPAEAAN